MYIYIYPPASSRVALGNPHENGGCGIAGKRIELKRAFEWENPL